MEIIEDKIIITVEEEAGGQMEIIEDKIIITVEEKPVIIRTEGPGGGFPVWGEITGTLSHQTDLQTALDGKSNVGHMHSELFPIMLIDEDLNDILPDDTTYYFAGDLNTVSHSAFPTGTAFGLVVYRNAEGYRCQVMTSSGGAVASRVWRASVWSSWQTWVLDGYPATTVDLLLSAKADSSDLGALAWKNQADWDTDLSNIPQTFPPSAHDHDDRYYTEGETDTLLAGKSDTGHTHDDRYYTKTQIDAALLDKADVITDTASGDIVSFPDGTNTSVKDLTASIEPVQDLHGYDHPWPAGGGKNLIPDGTDTSKGFVGNMYLKSDGTYGSVTSMNISEYFPVKPSTVYGWKKYSNQGAMAPSLCFYDANKDYISGESYNTRYDFTVTSPATAAFARVTILNNPANATLFMAGSDYPASWEPYANVCPISGWTGCNVVVSPTLNAQDGTTYSISWQTEAGTIGGGTLDVLTGLLTVTHAYAVITETDGRNNYLPRARIVAGLVKKPPSGDDPGNVVISSYLPAVGNNTTRDVNDYGISPTNSNPSTIYIRIPDFTTIAEYDAYLAEHPLQVVYELATSVTYQLTPQQVTTLLGDNNIFTDTGAVTVTYRADTKGYIDKMIARVEALILDQG